MADNINQNMQPNDPTTTQIKANPTQSGVPVVGGPTKIQAKTIQKQNTNLSNSVDPYKNYNSEKVQRESGQLRSYADTYVDNPYGAEYFKSKFWGMDMGAVSSTGGDFIGGANPFNENYDFEHDRRSGQSTVGAGVGILNQFVAKTSINTAGSILAGFYGIGSMAANDWDTSKLWDNSVARGFDKATEWVDENNSVFTSEHARSQQGALLQMFNVEGMKNLGDGMSFVAGAVLSELAMGAMTGGVGNAIKGTSWGLRAANAMSKAGKLTTAQMGRLMSHSNDIALGSSSLAKTGEAIKRASSYMDELTKAGISTADDLSSLSTTLGINAAEDMVKFQKLNNFITSIPRRARSVITGTFWEAGLEARQGKDDFYQKQMESVDNELSLRTDLTDAQKAEERVRREKIIKDMSNDVGNGIFTLNTMVLQGSNMIQFPSLFGRPAVLGKLGDYIADRASPFKKVASSMTDEGYKLKNLAKAGVIAKNAGRILKKPITEGLEEMSQSAISDLMTTYYDDQLSAEYQQNLLSGEYSDFKGQFANSLAGRTLNQLGHTFTDEEAYKEGVIGAVMGLLGAPSFRMNANGKLRPHIAGGIWEDIKTAKSDYKSLATDLTALNSQKSDLTSILGLNEHQAIINKKMAAKDELAQLTMDEIQLHENQETNISNYVIRMNKLGMKESIDESIKDIESMSIEEYRSAFNKGEDYTEADKAEDMRAFKDTAKRYSDAYALVNKSLNLDTMKSNSTLEKMTNVLVHGIGYEKYLNQQREALINDPRFIEALTNNGLTQKDIDKMIKDSYEFKAVSDIYQNTINELANSNKEAFKKNLDNLEMEMETLLESLPSDVRSAARNLLEAKKSNKDVDKAIGEFDAVMLDQNVDTSDNIIKILDRYSQARKEHNEGVSSLDAKKIEEWANSNDPEKVKAAKKIVDDTIERMNKAIKTQYEDDTKGFVKTSKEDGPKTFKYDDVLKYLKANKQLDDLDTFLRNQEENVDISELLNGDFKTIKDAKSRLYLLENKRLSTVQLARDLIKMGGSRAYHKINIDSFNYGMKELNFVIANLEYAVDTDNENELTVQSVTLRDLVAKMREKADKLLEEKAVTEKDLNESMDVLKRAEKLLSQVEGILEKKIVQERAKEITDENADKIEKEPTEIETLTMGNNVPSLNPDKKGNEQGDPVKTKTENTEDGEVTEKEKETLSKVAARDLNSITAEINETEISALSPKLMFTINPARLPDEGIIRDSDINYPNNEDPKHSLRYKIDNGIIKYNSGGELIIPETDPLHTEDAIDYARAIFGVPTENRTQEQIDADKALYLEGLDKLKADGGINLLDVPFENMDPAVKFYIANTRVIQKYYDKQVSYKEGSNHQSLNIEETDEPIHTGYLYAATLAHDVSEINKEREAYNRKLSKIKEKHLSAIDSLKEQLDENKITPDQYQNAIKILEDVYNDNIDTTNAGFDSLINGKNDFVNFSLRLNAIKSAMSGKPLQFRVGNFLYGTIDKAAVSGKDSNGNLVDTFPLVSNDINENPLFNEADPFSIDKLAYVDRNGNLVSFKDGDIVKNNTGSPVSHRYLTTGKIYALITMNNGHRIPIALNTEKLGREQFEPMMDEIVEIMNYYKDVVHQDDKSPNEKVKFKDDTLFGYAKGMTYRQFFSSIANSQKGSDRSLMSDLGGFIGFKGDTGQLSIGESTILEKDIDVDKDGNNIFDRVKGIISNGHFRISRNAMFKTTDNGKPDYENVNQEYLDFLMNNNILNHTVITSSEDKIQRVFEPILDKNNEPYGIRPQIHMLNSHDGIPEVPMKQGYTSEKKKLVYALLFGKGKIDNGKLKEEYSTSDVIKGLYNAAGGKLIRRILATPNITEDQKKEFMTEIINELINEKINFAYEIFKATPSLMSDLGKKIIETRGDLDAINQLKLGDQKVRSVVDKYLFVVVKELRKMSTNPKITNTVINYASNIGLAREFRELLLSGSNTTLETFEAVEAKSDRTGGTYTIFKKGKGQLGGTDITSYKFQIEKLNSDLEKLESKLKSVKGTVDENGIQDEIDTLLATKKDLVEKRIEETRNVIKHILIVGNTMESVYNIEKLFGGSKYVPNFQFNHSTVKGFKGKANKPKSYRYNMDAEGNPIPLKGTDTVLENGSLVVNNKRGPFTLEFKTNDKNLISTDINDIDKIRFDENGEPINVNLMATTIKMKTKEEIAKQAEDNKKKDEKDRTYFTYDIGTAAVIQGTEMDNKHILVINELALPGLNADRTIDLPTQQRLITISNEYGANNMSFREIVNDITDHFKMKPNKDFGALGELNTSAKAKDVSNDNKTAKVHEVLVTGGVKKMEGFEVKDYEAEKAKNVKPIEKLESTNDIFAGMFEEVDDNDSFVKDLRKEANDKYSKNDDKLEKEDLSEDENIANELEDQGTISENTINNSHILESFKNALKSVKGFMLDMEDEIKDLFEDVHGKIYLNETEANKFLSAINDITSKDEDYLKLRTNFINFAKEKGFSLDESKLC